jgi:hypothetical protein
LHFACLGYAFTSVSAYETVGVGLDFDSFTEFDKYMDRHLQSGPEQPDIGFYASISGSPKLAVFALLTFLDAPQDQSYPVVWGYSMGKTRKTSAWTYHATDSTDKVFDKFRAAIRTISHTNPIDSRGFLRGLRDDLVLSRGKWSESVYDRILTNLETGAPWYQGFSDILTLLDEETNNAKLNDRLYYDLLCLFGGKMEMELIADIRSCVAARVKQSPYKGKDAWKRAKDEIVNILRLVTPHDFPGFNAALARIAILCDRGFREEVVEDIQRRKDARDKDLLIQGIYMWVPPKNPPKNGKAPPSPSADPTPAETPPNANVDQGFEFPEVSVPDEV